MRIFRIQIKKRLAYALGIIFALGLILGVWSFIIEPNQLVVRHQTVLLANWPSSLNGFRIAAMSDIHAGSPFIDVAKLQEIVVRTNAAKPDLIVLLGDFMVTDPLYWRVIDPEVTAEALKGLEAPAGVYVVLGNHDWVYDGIRVRRAFENAGMKVLDNEASQIGYGDRSLWLVGLADILTRPQQIDTTVNKVPFGEPIIAITHGPDIFPGVPKNVNLTIAGHTHGGQVNFPVLGPLVVPSKYGQRYASGLVQEDGKVLFVTTGIGTSLIPVRFRVPPEISILTINSLR
jgi:uncharacterized protein